ncbi:MAG: RHS repeat-associated core domain-containing protein [Microthrixaceae bacterium]
MTERRSSGVGVKRPGEFGRRASTVVSGGEGARRWGETLGFDDDGNVTSRSTTVGDPAAGGVAGSVLYAYDRAGRLTSETSGGSTVAFGWDGAGNRVSVTSPDGQQTGFSVDERNRTTGSTDGVSYGWDQAGDRVSVTDPDGAVTATGYDALGRPVEVDTNSGGVSTQVSYGWDGGGRLATRNMTVDGNTVADANLGYETPDSWDPVVVSDTLQVGTGPDGGQVSLGNSVTTTNFHGDLAAATDTDGSVYTQSFDTFGQNTGPTQGMFGFQSDLTEPVDGLVWMGARFYDPTTASFTSRDTYPGDVTDPITLNRYLYANANPTSNHDPDGHMGVKLTAEDRIRANIMEGPVQTQALAMYTALGVARLFMLTDAGVVLAEAAIATRTPIVASVPLITITIATVTLFALSMTVLEWEGHTFRDTVTGACSS